jgi:hypothetical protein
MEFEVQMQSKDRSRGEQSCSCTFVVVRLSGVAIHFLLSFEHRLTLISAKIFLPVILSFSNVLGLSTLVTWSINISSHSLAIMYAVVLILIPLLLSLVSSAYVAPRDGTYLDLERTNRCADIRQNAIILPLRQPTHRPRCRKLLTPSLIQPPNSNVK